MKRRITTLGIAAIIIITLASCVAYEPGAPVTPAENSPTEVPAQTTEAPDVTVVVFDVGEALSVLIDDEDTEILIDSGNDRDGPVIADKLGDYITDGTLEYVIATHSHADHIGGFEDIYDAYHVLHTIYGDTGTTKQFAEFMNAATAEEESDVFEDEDMKIELPSGAVFNILDILDGDKNTNNNSVISVLEYGETKMLVTGDAEDEKNLKNVVRPALIGRLQAENFYPIDIYIVGHHGSETSSSEELLALIKPELAIVSSVGPSGQYHNPDGRVLDRILNTGATVFATYRSQDITISINIDSYSVSAPDSEILTLENYLEAA
jgi:beta-lactamase superfamily II metal-dependent hydrolase